MNYLLNKPIISVINAGAKTTGKGGLDLSR